MPGKHLRVDVFSQPPQQRRRALDVGEKNARVSTLTA